MNDATKGLVEKRIAQIQLEVKDRQNKISDLAMAIKRQEEEIRALYAEHTDLDMDLMSAS